jgi:hypothetical protein
MSPTSTAPTNRYPAGIQLLRTCALTAIALTNQHLTVIDAFPWQEKLVAPLDATLKNVAKGTRKGKAQDETTLQNEAKKTKWTLS